MRKSGWGAPRSWTPSTTRRAEYAALSLPQGIGPDHHAKTSTVHLASWNAKENPLDVYYRGEFHNA